MTTSSFGDIRGAAPPRRVIAPFEDQSPDDGQR